jgi:RimJ/RimL family protein N-acetyltransferase
MRTFPPDGYNDGVVSLRRWTDEDIPFITEYCQDPDIQRWTIVPSPYTEADAKEFIEGVSVSEDHASLAICDMASGDPMGSVGITVWDDVGVGGIGYLMAPAYRGKGFAPLAVRLLAKWAIEDLGLARVQIHADEHNDSSRRVAEKAGFTFEGVMRSYREVKGRRIDAAMYSLLPGDRVS